ncbi:MAG: 3'(2'),5'-bisphosphate nucleotidase CysQ [Spiribacter salinus]|uniref:3'(2'),5'-bisphosphate nucleotidase CysQ n=1 Tax=Spiribacter salinus TaxID=1335746 RepID=A0A540VMZ0_9GAMM|nr:MAG: 3'(2'),5'-bisphosphate nucleotidase CysQ [Spiribacter salinus]
MDNALDSLAEEAARIAEAAGREILSIYAADFDVQTKPDDSPLTRADLTAHTLINDALEALTPDIPVLSEEGGIPVYETRREWRRYWLVDPLDGTREFIKRNGEFTVNIALIDTGRPVIGIVHAPVLSRTYVGVQNLSNVGVQHSWAERRDMEGTAAVATRAVPAEGPMTLVVSRSHRSPAVDALLERLPDYETTSMGSSLKFCLVAEGSADAYPRFGPTSEWDSGAAQCIIEAAGGAVIRTDGTPLRYNTKASTLNPDFIAVGDPAWAWRQHLADFPLEER